ncbi:OLC1v1019931C2 [Oldenlandia corymbosa var. corymbosa]|uniref:OLC1v1019931C2 n=1 Tax=Oldenlandia corymbosa var. corymbosa TaxID=529605 RepID=A0AAV1EFB1_OLDCO|nr:OLC1v1019931C2 [Oldenlandia corymbosa var. corymbosa]
MLLIHLSLSSIFEYLPPEIGRLSNLEFLDLSFNKMKNLPTELTLLNSLVSLEVANNKLVEVPSGLSSLKRLENLDLSNNRLTSFVCLELESMHNLQRLNLQNNKLRMCCQIPSWICCNLEGNGKDLSIDEFISSAEMDGVECSPQEADSAKDSSVLTLSLSIAPTSNHKSLAARKSKGWRRCHTWQQRARQERLNSSRKWKMQNHNAIRKAAEACLICPDDSVTDGSSATRVEGVKDTKSLSEADDFQNSITSMQDNDLTMNKDAYVRKCSCNVCDSPQKHKEMKSVCKGHDDCSSSIPDDGVSLDECICADASSSITKSKRHSDAEPDNPKPRKYRRPTDNQSDVSAKYNQVSYCAVDDYLSDGFYDAGRDRPFMPLNSYEEILPLDSREVILLDRERDEKLDVLLLCAQALVSRFRHINVSLKERANGASDSIQIASLLAFFVSDHFGGSDKSAAVLKARKAVSGSNYRKPFVCTCPTGSDDRTKRTMKESLDAVGDIVFHDLCERALQSIKCRLKSIVVPIGSLQFGVCRHRAVLMKYLCDRVNPPMHCELVRGFLDFSPHAWNVIAVKRGQSWVRMIVDACHPHDIREETDPEYFCRYIPLSRLTASVVTDSNSAPEFPPLSTSEQLGKTASNTILECKIGSIKAAAKVRTLEVCGTSADDIRNFEFCCLGEARMLSSLTHPCIVKYYGHQVSSKWVSSSNGNSDVRILQSALFMEYIKGGSLKLYLEELGRNGANRVPVLLALFIARDVAFALTDLHDRHIIHRDIKSENILIDLDEKKDDSSPIVKLADFDRAVPLRASLHSCCIAHTGVPPPDVCVGTPRWMAPEVLRARTEHSLYGLEVDIWSFGCLLLEMLTLQIPYSGLAEQDIQKNLERGRRPPLTKELGELVDSGRDLEVPEIMAELETELEESEIESKMLKFLVSMYHWCTGSDPRDRPSATKIEGEARKKRESSSQQEKLGNPSPYPTIAYRFGVARLSGKKKDAPEPLARTNEARRQLTWSDRDDYFRKIWGHLGIDKVILLLTGLFVVRFHTLQARNDALSVVFYQSRVQYARVLVNMEISDNVPEKLVFEDENGEEPAKSTHISERINKGPAQCVSKKVQEADKDVYSVLPNDPNQTTKVTKETADGLTLIGRSNKAVVEAEVLVAMSTSKMTEGNIGIEPDPDIYV